MSLLEDIQAIESPLIVAALKASFTPPTDPTLLAGWNAGWLAAVEAQIGAAYTHQGAYQGQVVYLPLFDTHPQLLVCLASSNLVGPFNVANRVLGVSLAEGSSDPAIAKFLYAGVTTVLVKDSTAVTAGDWLVPSDSNDGRVMSGGGTKTTNTVGFAIDTVTSGTDKVVTIMVDVSQYEVPA